MKQIFSEVSTTHRFCSIEMKDEELSTMLTFVEKKRNKLFGD